MIERLWGQCLRHALEWCTFLRESVLDMELHHWAVVFVGVVLIGTLCLRGLGSRKHY